MLAHLFPELLVHRDGTACDFWGYMQEDQLLGNLRAFLDAALLARVDVISPLPAPFYHAGPFMVYRNTPHVNALYRQSSQWRAVAKSANYLAFDEWWGPELKDDMSDVVQRAHRNGKVRAYVAVPQSDRKVWLQDDYVYSDPHAAAAPPAASSGGVAARGTRSAAAAAKVASGASSSAAGTDGPADAWANQRWYDDTMLLTWQLGPDGIGRLWAGPGTAETRDLWAADGQGQRALVHLLGSKHRRPLRGLRGSADWFHECARARTVHVSTRGVLLAHSSSLEAADGGGDARMGKGARIGRDGEAVARGRGGAIGTSGGGGGVDGGLGYSWYSGAFPRAHARVHPADVRTSLARLWKLGRPRSEGSLSLQVDATLPCVRGVHFDGTSEEVAPRHAGLIACFDGNRTDGIGADAGGEGGASGRQRGHKKIKKWHLKNSTKVKKWKRGPDKKTDGIGAESNVLVDARSLDIAAALLAHEVASPWKTAVTRKGRKGGPPPKKSAAHALAKSVAARGEPVVQEESEDGDASNEGEE